MPDGVDAQFPVELRLDVGPLEVAAHHHFSVRLASLGHEDERAGLLPSLEGEKGSAKVRPWQAYLLTESISVEPRLRHLAVDIESGRDLGGDQSANLFRAHSLQDIALDRGKTILRSLGEFGVGQKNPTTEVAGLEFKVSNRPFVQRLIDRDVAREIRNPRGRVDLAMDKRVPYFMGKSESKARLLMNHLPLVDDDCSWLESEKPVYTEFSFEVRHRENAQPHPELDNLLDGNGDRARRVILPKKSLSLSFEFLRRDMSKFLQRAIRRDLQGLELFSQSNEFVSIKLSSCRSE
jgi:hypothetical protein